MEFELVKIVCTAVIATRNGDRIIGEDESRPFPCYSPEQMTEHWEAVIAEVAARNELEKQGNRAARRRAPKRKGNP